MKPEVQTLLELNPLLADMGETKIKDLIDAFYETGYEWNVKEKFFFNVELDKFIKAEAMHKFYPEDIREFWGNPEFVKGFESNKKSTKNSIIGILGIPISLISGFIWGWKIGLILFIVSIGITVIYSGQKKDLFANY